MTIKGFFGSLNESWMVGKAQVIVSTEVGNLFAVGLD
jgi:hypothetical protein